MSNSGARTSGGIDYRNLFFAGAAHGVQIVAITGWNDEHYEDAEAEVDLKYHDVIDERLKIVYRVTGMGQRIRLWLELPENDTIRSDFYAQYQSGTFQPPVVATLVHDEFKNPGEYEVWFDGRDGTPDRRLLLAGSYVVRLEGVIFSYFRRDDRKELRVARPKATNFGIHYKKRSSWHSTKREVEHAFDREGSLQDGSGFVAEKYLDYDAENAFYLIRESAVTYWSGHSHPAGLFFHEREGGPYSSSHSSNLFLFSETSESPNVSLSREIRESPALFKDLFMVILNGCRTANEVFFVQAVLRRFHPKGIDGIHGEKTTDALTAFQQHNDLEPADGSLGAQTLAWFGMEFAEGTDPSVIREVQRRLTRYWPGEADGKMGSNTSGALKNYQEDHPTLEATGEIDDATLTALKITRTGTWDENEVPVNITSGVAQMGADLTIGFEHKVGFDIAEDWAIKFWDHAAQGQGINTAASNAQALLDHRRRDECNFRLYAQNGVSPESTLHPARYGKAE